MTEKRLVECQDCGYRWKSSAAEPRCSKSECGRSRNVEAVADDLDDDPGQGDRDEPEPVEDDQEDDDEDDQEDSDQQPSGPDELPEIDPETLEPALKATFNLAATNRGDHWELDDEEAEKLAEGWCPVINHYAPHFLRQYTELGAAVIVTYTVVGPRLAEDKKLAELEEKATDDETGTVRRQRTEEDDAVEIDELPDEEQTPASEAGEESQIGGYAAV